MGTDKLSQFIKKLVGGGSLDHPDFDAIDQMGGAEGLDPMTSRRAFFAARDLQSLHEAEKLDGGDGSETATTNPLSLLLKVKKRK